MSIAPGWYPDPLAPDAVRWWSGEVWTGSTHQVPRQPLQVEPVPAQPVPVPTHPWTSFSPTPVVRHPGPKNPWAPAGATPHPYGHPGRAPRRRSRLFGAVAVLVVLGLVVAAVQVAVSGGGAAKIAATGYLQALERGDTAAAYQDWCAADRAVYPKAVFRAQHEWRAGHANRVVSSMRGGQWSADKASGAVQDDEGTLKDLPLERTAGRWEICPRGDRLQGDMANCGCMTPAQKLEADVAGVAALQAEHYPFVEVKCPPIPALVDGKAVRCTAAAADGRTWAVTATESAHATRTNVRIVPTGTVS